MAIHPQAIVDKRAEVAPDAEVGPFAIVEDGVSIGPRVKIFARAYICRGTQIGEDSQIHMGAVIGHEPQDLSYKGGESFVKIGKRTIIREYATIHRGTREGSTTVIGDDNFLMAVSHVGHNCQVGNHVIISNGALLAGYVQVEDQVFISGNVVIHQYCRIGTLAMIGGFSAVNKDIPPYMLVRGACAVRTINLVGLRRAGLSREIIGDIKDAFRYLYLSDMNISQAVEKIKTLRPSKELEHLVRFIEESKRGISHTTDLGRKASIDS